MRSFSSRITNGRPRLLEVIADSQTCLASTDDDGSELLIDHSSQLSTRKISRRPLSTRS